MPNVIKIAADITTVNSGAAVALNKSPLLGGQGREAKYSIPTLPLTSTVKLQGAPATAAGGIPVTNDPNWADLLTITSASDQAAELPDLPEFIRHSTTVLDADGPAVAIYLEGVQRPNPKTPRPRPRPRAKPTTWNGSSQAMPIATSCCSRRMRAPRFRPRCRGTSCRSPRPSTARTTSRYSRKYTSRRSAKSTRRSGHSGARW